MSDIGATERSPKRRGSSRVRAMVVRQWRLVRALVDRRQGLTATALIAETAIPRSTLYRDLGQLIDAGVPIRKQVVNGEVRHVLLETRLPPLGASALQLAALRLARSTLTALEGTTLVEELDRLLDGRRADHGGGMVSANTPRGASAPALVRMLERAMSRRRQLRIQYRGASDSTLRLRTIEPAALRLCGDHLYLIAWDLGRDAWRTFKIVRIAEAAELPEPASERPAYDEEALFEHAVKVWSGDPVDVAVRLAPEVAWRAGEWPLVEGQRVEPRPDGAVVVRARVAGVVEATRWVLSWGAAAEALAPPELRAAVASELVGALDRYGRAKGEWCGRGMGTEHADAPFPREQALRRVPAAAPLKPCPCSKGPGARATLSIAFPRRPH